jgi:hypothetical protein
MVSTKIELPHHKFRRHMPPARTLFRIKGERMRINLRGRTGSLP